MADDLQPPPWPDYHKPNTSPCWCHYRNEPITWRTYIVCFECGHVWTRWSLRWAYANAYPEHGWLHSLRRFLRTRTKAIYFCQECIHDF